MRRRTLSGIQVARASPKINHLLFADDTMFFAKTTERSVMALKEVIKKYTSSITEVYSKGNSRIEKAIYFIHLGDWVSVLLGELRGADLMEVNVINHLKSKLSEI